MRRADRRDARRRHKAGPPKQTTPHGVGDAGQRSRSAVSTSSVQHDMLRTTEYSGPRSQLKDSLIFRIILADFRYERGPVDHIMRAFRLFMIQIEKKRMMKMMERVEA